MNFSKGEGVTNTLLLVSLLVGLCQGEVYGIWDDVFGGGGLQFYTIDEQTGNQTNLVYTNQDYLTLFGFPVTTDPQNKIVYLPLMNATDLSTMNGHVVGFDLSNPNNIVVSMSVAIPFYLCVVLFDQTSKTIYVGGNKITDPGKANETVSEFIIGAVDPVKHVYKQLLEFPQGSQLTFATLGSTAAVDEKNQKLVMGMIKNTPTTATQFVVVTVDLNSLAINVVNQTVLNAQALAWNPLDGKIYALASLVQQPTVNSLNISWAVLNDDTVITPISTWQNTDFIFVIDGIITTDFTNQKGYSIIGNGEGPPVAFTSWDTASGKLLSFGVYDDQPQFLVVL